MLPYSRLTINTGCYYSREMWENTFFNKVGVRSPPLYSPGLSGSRRLLNSQPVEQPSVSWELPVRADTTNHYLCIPRAPADLDPGLPGPSLANERRLTASDALHLPLLPDTPFHLLHPLVTQAQGGSEGGLSFPNPGPHWLPFLKLLAPNQRQAGWLLLWPCFLRSPIRRRLWCLVPDRSRHSGLRRDRSQPLGWPRQPPCPH